MKRDLAQLVVFLAWFALLVRYTPLWDLMRATPRIQKAVVGAVLLVWTVAQVAVIPMALFPMISVHMYATHTAEPTINGVRIMGVSCAGERHYIDIGPLMTRPAVKGRVQGMYLGLRFARSPADSARRLTLLSETLSALGRLYNKQYAENPLCGIALDATTVTTGDDGPGEIPEPRPVYHVDLR